MENAIKIIAPKGEVYPYIDSAKAYLQVPYQTFVGEFANGNDPLHPSIFNPNSPIVLKWKCANAEKFILEYGRLPDYADAEKVEVHGGMNGYGLYNLYKGTLYFWRVTAILKTGERVSAEDTFTTTALGPRVMKVDGIYNVRDLGGYKTSFGKTTKQGLLYRGGSLTPADIFDSQLSESGAKCMCETMKIKTELDFRGQCEENEYPEQSPIPSARLVCIPAYAYAEAFTEKAQESHRRLFSMLADINNYPVYFHCTGGADRTGTIAYLLNALLGVGEEDLLHDYEFTSFSIYGQRSAEKGDYQPFVSDFFKCLDGYPGETLAQKTESYLRSIGVTVEEIEAFRGIMTK